jgi:hypothetical protein
MKLKKLYNTPTLEFYTPDYSTSAELPFNASLDENLA